MKTDIIRGTFSPWQKKKKRISAGIWFCWSSLAKELKKTAIKQENKNSSTFYIGNPKTTTLITSLVWSYPVVEAQTSLLRAFHGARKEREETDFYESADCKIIRHFLIVSSLCFKARPSARPLIRKLIFYSHASNIHFHKRDVEVVYSVKIKGVYLAYILRRSELEAAW